MAQKAERLDPFGNVVAPLPLSSREVHALQVGLDGALADFVRYSVLAGYAYDRRNEGAPFAAAALVWQPREALEIGLRASRAVNTARGTGNAVDAVGGYVLWRY